MLFNTRTLSVKLLVLFLIFSSILIASPDLHEVAIRTVSRTILLDGKLQAHAPREINAPFEGTIIKIIEDGSQVTKGQALFELDTFNVRRDLQRAQIELLLKQNELSQIRISSIIEALADASLVNDKETDFYIKEKILNQKKFTRNPREILRMKLQTKKTSQMIEFYKEHLAELEKLGKQGALSNTELADERIKYREYLVNLEQLKLDYEKLRDGNPLEINRAQKNTNSARIKLNHVRKELSEKADVRKANIRVKQDEVDELKLKVKDLEIRLSQSTIKATTDGIFLVNSHWVGNGYEAYREGHHVKYGEELAKVSQSDKLLARFEVYESDAGLIEVGQNVKFQIIPLGDKWFEGVISKIHPTLAPKPRQKDDLYRLKVLRVDMEVKNILPSMKPKMTVIAKVQVFKKSGLSIPLECLKDNNIITQNGQQEITIGSYGDSYVEIIDGLKIGQKIICDKAESKSPSNFSLQAKAKEETVYTSIDGTGELVAKDEILLSPAFSASIKKIIKSGQRVRKDDVVLIIDSQNLDTELQSKEIELTQKKVELKTEKLKANTELVTLENEILDLQLEVKVESKQLQILSTGESSLEIAKQELQEKRAEIERQFQKLNFEIQTTLKKNGYVKSSDYQKSLELLKDAEIDKKIEELELEIKRTPSSKTEYQKQQAVVKNLKFKLLNSSKQLTNRKNLLRTRVEIAETKLKLANFDVDIINNKLSKAEIRAPKDGIFLIGEHYSQSTIVPYKVGDNLSPGSIAGRIIQFDGFVIQGKLDESDFHKLKLNQNVQFYLTGRKNKLYPGKIVHIAPIPRTDGIWWVKRESPTINLTIDVLANSKNFQPGSTVQYEVKIGKERKGITIPINAVYQNRNHYEVYVGKGRKQKVKIGRRQHNRIEIIEGLSIGQMVFWEGE